MSDNGWIVFWIVVVIALVVALVWVNQNEREDCVKNGGRVVEHHSFKDPNSWHCDEPRR